MNRVILMGRLTKDPDVRYATGDNSMAIARYTLAVDRRQSRNNNGEATADFISCIAFGKSGEFAEKYLKKGTKMIITGRIQTGSYTNKDGQKVYTTDVVVEDQEFAESKNASAGSGSNDNIFASFGPDGKDSRLSSSGQAAGKIGQTPSSPDRSGFMELPEEFEDLPFA